MLNKRKVRGVRFGVYLPGHIHDELMGRVAADGQTRNGLIRKALDAYFEVLQQEDLAA